MNMMSQNRATPYPVVEWNSYARLFASVTTSMQLGVYREACLHLRGDVIDCGCGAAKIAPFLNDDDQVHSYTGLDLSEDMVSMAEWILSSLGNSDFSVRHSRIEDFLEAGFSSAVSIQSYYSWPEPLKTLERIFDMLASGGVFILATPNNTLSVDTLTKDVQQELLAHPDFEAYKAYNLKLANNPLANFVEMDDLVTQTKNVGFQLLECHQKHFRGGLNFLKLKKQD